MFNLLFRNKLVAEPGFKSSRGEFVGAGPNAGIYKSNPIPPDYKDLPIYLNDELLVLGGKVNNLIEGGIFAPQSELPVRFKEGMTVFFMRAIPNTDITSSGIWLYRSSKWWKLIDDPVVTQQTLTVYGVSRVDQDTPKKPEDNVYLPSDLVSWFYEPFSPREGYHQWMCFAPRATLGANPSVKWTEPFRFRDGEVDPGIPQTLPINKTELKNMVREVLLEIKKESL